MIAISKIRNPVFCKTVEAFLTVKLSSFLFRNTCVEPRAFGYRFYCDKGNKDRDSTIVTPHDNDSTNIKNQIGLESRYKIFQDSDAPILLDVYEEKSQLEQSNINSNEEEDDKFHGINLERGVQGVYDIEDLIELLRRDKAEDIFVAELSPEASYVDYIVIVNGRSRRHMTALSEMVRRVFKKKRLSTDILPRIEGETSSDWMALDLGNIALHIFSRQTRSVYDLESLWSVGPEFDPLINTPDDALTTLMKKHSISYTEFQSKEQLL